MVAIIKVKIVYTKSETFAKDGKVVWLYNSLDESLHKGSNISEGALNNNGYKLMRKGKGSDQYSIDLLFKGTKDLVYLALEKEIRPILRDKQLREIFEN